LNTGRRKTKKRRHTDNSNLARARLSLVHDVAEDGTSPQNVDAGVTSLGVFTREVHVHTDGSVRELRRRCGHGGLHPGIVLCARRSAPGYKCSRRHIPPSGTATTNSMRWHAASPALIDAARSAKRGSVKVAPATYQREVLGPKGHEHTTSAGEQVHALIRL
jgi:hypothetical protein